MPGNYLVFSGEGVLLAETSYHPEPQRYPEGSYQYRPNGKQKWMQTATFTHPIEILWEGIDDEQVPTHIRAMALLLT